MATAAWTEIDWRTHVRWVQVGRQALNVAELGDGERAVVFVHGVGGAWQNWLENIPAIADAGYRAVAFDLPGFGSSPLPREPFTIPSLAELVRGLLDQLGIEGAALVGNSMGGFISAETALVAPERVERLVLVSPAGLSIQAPENERRIARVRRLSPVLARWNRFQAAHAFGIARRARLRIGAMRYATSHPERLDPRLVAEHVRWADGPGFVQALDAVTSHPLRARLHEISCPTLVVHGEGDRLVPVADADVFAAEIPGARKLVYPETGHLAMLEQPARFNADLLAFLSS
jgi:pimeloyl-ACP methyl ester carboxylesterase